MQMEIAKRISESVCSHVNNLISMIIAIMKSEAITVVEDDDDNEKNINKNNKQYNDV